MHSVFVYLFYVILYFAITGYYIGRAHVCTPVTPENLVCRLLLEKKKVGTHGPRIRPPQAAGGVRPHRHDPTHGTRRRLEGPGAGARGPPLDRLRHLAWSHQAP